MLLFLLLHEQSIYWGNSVHRYLDIKSTIWFLGVVECIFYEYFLFLLSAEAGYVATPIAMVQAAITLLTDASDLPKA